MMAGWAFSVRVISSIGPSAISWDRFWSRASSTSSKTARAVAKLSAKRLAHADGLAALSGKSECKRHQASSLATFDCTR
jgi:hypothetical protein